MKLTEVENVALEQLAVAGVSFYVASGDDGAADCRAANPGAKFLAIDDPSGSAVRDRRRRDESSDAVRRVERAWKGSGGGISINWPKPGFQRGGRTPDVPGGFCASGTAQCRVTPDVALDAAPQTGYIIRSHGLGGLGATYGIVGGTSAAAPLMAAITADANESAGKDLGYANPFLYQTLDADDRFLRHHAGQQRQLHRLELPGRAGIRHGHGARRARRRHVRDRAWPDSRRVVPTFDTTKLTATHPTNMKRVKKGAVVTFEGVLTNVTGAHPIANRQIIVIGNGGIIGVDRTGTSGKWEIRFKVKKRTSWHAVFMGSGSEKPDLSPTLTVRIQH